MSKVSIIMPSLNVVRYIRQCMDSVVNQTLDDIEIVLVDAGSTDGTLEILEDYAVKDSRIILLHSEVKSYGHQMNIGIKEASGEYIGVVETDDYVEPDMFEKLYESAKRHDAEIVKGLMYRRYEYGNAESIEMPVDYIGGAGIENKLLDCTCNADILLYNSNLWNGIYKKAFLVGNAVKFNETPGAAFQDIGFHHQVFSCAQRVVYIKEYIYHYRVFREGSSSWNSNTLRYMYEEYKWLSETGRLNRQNDTVFLKMALDMLWEYKKLLQYHDFDTSLTCCSDMLSFFRSEFNRLESNDVFCGTAIERELYLFMLDNGWFENECRNKVHAVQGWLKSFSENALRNGLVLFGMGACGTFLAPFLIRNRLPPAAYTDNAGKLWGTAVNLPMREPPVVQPPQAVCKRFSESTYLIASRKHASDIKEQLLAAGIKEKNISVYDDSDVFLRQALSAIPYVITE